MNCCSILTLLLRNPCFITNYDKRHSSPTFSYSSLKVPMQMQSFNFCAQKSPFLGPILHTFKDSITIAILYTILCEMFTNWNKHSNVMDSKNTNYESVFFTFWLHSFHIDIQSVWTLCLYSTLHHEHLWCHSLYLLFLYYCRPINAAQFTMHFRSMKTFCIGKLNYWLDLWTVRIVYFCNHN